METEQITRQRIRNLIAEFDDCNGYGPTLLIGVGGFIVLFGLVTALIGIPMLAIGLYMSHMNSCRRVQINRDVALLNMELPE